ncbi:MAG: hypothetical protein E5Y51_02310 [Mesorhizobium sp.]|nr:MAG: hypothetical protein E5Y51_02310 [Mesorhizobium sp.]
MALSFIFDASKETPASIAKQRAVVEALMQSQRTPRNIGEGLNALGDGIVMNVLGHRADAAEQAGQSHASDVLNGLFNGNTFPAAPGSNTLSASSGGRTDYHGDQLAWTDAAPYQKAFLNTLAGPESGGRYDVIYGGSKFSDFSHHPNQAVRIQTGPNAGRTSSAAGKYQFLGSTWDDQAQKLGLTDFSPVNQDKAAWNLAAETYKAKTGQDLATVLQSGDPSAIAGVGNALRGVWTSLPGGIEQGTTTDRFVAAYQRALGSGASPAQATAVAQQQTAQPVKVASLDPSMGVAAATVRPLPQEYAAKGITQEQWDAMNAPDGAVVQTAPATPTGGGYAPGMPATTTARGQRVLSTLMTPEPLSGRGGVVQALTAANPPAAPSGGASGVTQALTDAPGGAAPASPAVQKVLQALSPPDASLPAMAGGSADVVQPGAAGPSVQDLMRAAADPWLSEQQRGVVNMMLEQQVQNADPLRQLQIQKAKRDLAIQPKQWQKLDDNTLFDATSGETRTVPGATAKLFEGNSLDAQAWNILRTADPNSQDYATAYAIVSQPKQQLVQTPDGQMLINVPPPLPAWLKAPGGAATSAPNSPGATTPPSPTSATAPVTAPTPTGAPQGGATAGGLIPGTAKPTETQRNRVSAVNQAFDAINTELDRYTHLVGKSGIEAMPGQAKDNLNTVRQGIMLQLKELFNLGVLNGPDLSLMERMIYDPVVDPLKEGGLANLPSQLYSAAVGDAPARAQNSVAELRRMLSGIKDAVDKTVPTGPAPQGSADDLKKKYGLD